MTKYTKIFLRLFFGIGSLPKNRMWRCYKYGERSLGIVGLLFICLHIFPQMLFSHSIEVDGITLHSRQPLNDNAIISLKRAATLINDSELSREGRAEEIFLCDSKLLFQLFKPRSTSFGYSVPVTDHVFLSAENYSMDTLKRFGGGFNERSLSSVIAHEVTHGLIRNRLGVVKGSLLPRWIQEGYAEYIANESSFPEARGLEILLSGEYPSSGSFHYYHWRMVVTYLVDERGFDFSDLVRHSDDFAKYLKETVDHLREAQASMPEGEQSISLN